MTKAGAGSHQNSPTPSGAAPPLPTEVDVLGARPLGVGHVLAEGLQDLLLHLRQRVGVHGSHAQRVHAAALEGHVQVLHERRNERSVGPHRHCPGPRQVTASQRPGKIIAPRHVGTPPSQFRRWFPPCFPVALAPPHTGSPGAWPQCSPVAATPH